MNKGLVSNYKEADNYLIDNFDTFSVALSFSIDPDIVEGWTVERMAWAKTALKVKGRIEGGK